MEQNQASINMRPNEKTLLELIEQAKKENKNILFMLGCEKCIYTPEFLSGYLHEFGEFSALSNPSLWQLTDEEENMDF